MLQTMFTTYNAFFSTAAGRAFNAMICTTRVWRSIHGVAIGAADRESWAQPGPCCNLSRSSRNSQPEIALVGAGAGADVIGPDPSQIRKTDVEEVLRVFPRLRFRNAFVNTCAEVVRKHPKGCGAFIHAGHW